MIGWTKNDVWYYGVRFSKSSFPEELWVSYFTSSKYVKQYRKMYGEPDVIQIRKTFDDKEKARIWEHKVLRRMKVIRDEKWLKIGRAHV
mgnify:CR=1 FL=1